MKFMDSIQGLADAHAGVMMHVVRHAANKPLAYNLKGTI